MSTPRNGFKPLRHLTGGQIRSKLLPVALPANRTLFIGDPVFAVTAGTIEPLSATPSQVPLGVVTALYDTNKKPLTFSQPTRGPYLASGASGYADVIIDPFVTYLVQCDTSVAANTVINVNADVTAGAGNARSGISGYGVKSLAATSTLPFKVIGLAPTELTGAGGTDNGLEVMINREAFLRADGKNLS